MRRRSRRCWRRSSANGPTSSSSAATSRGGRCRRRRSRSCVRWRFPPVSSAGMRTARSGPTSRAGESGWHAAHSADDLVFLGGFEQTVIVDVDGLGATCFAHGSPRSDEECVTRRTPDERVREFSDGDRGERVRHGSHAHAVRSPGGRAPARQSRERRTSLRDGAGGVLGHARAGRRASADRIRRRGQRSPGCGRRTIRTSRSSSS